MIQIPLLINPLRLLQLMVFLGAFLSFSMEPMSARMLVPFFGGAVHVWLTCMMFFQGMLLAGYLYSHYFARRLGGWHLILLFAPLISLPFAVSPSIVTENQVGHLLLWIAKSFGLPFFVLSTTAVVGQLWLTSSDLPGAESPYTLYAASNLGSFIGLLGYPLVFEPLFGVRMQTWLWGAGYLLYVALAGAAWRFSRGGVHQQSRQRSQSINNLEKPQAADYFIWLLLSALPSALFLSVTSIISLEVGSFPLIWIAPLALYLSSFIFTFSQTPRVPFRDLWLEVVFLGLVLYVLPTSRWLMVLAHLLLLFLLCTRCHLELYLRRPPVGWLSNFYITLSVGGWLGGLLVSVVAPVVFNGLYEYIAILIAIGFLLLVLNFREFIAFWKNAHILKAGVRLFPIAAMMTALWVAANSYLSSEVQFKHRNFYGTYKVIDTPVSQENPEKIRKLLHGVTMHGSQLLEPENNLVPTSYYHIGGNIAGAFDVVASPKKIAVVGLGTGTAALFVKDSDSISFYEIDPDNEKIAREWFTFLSQVKGRLSISVGDGRLALQKMALEAPQYDLLFIDAFTGDGIPTHLLTKEAFEIYLDVLGPKGILLIHISNRYYDLAPVVLETAASLKLQCVLSPKRRAIEEPWATPSICIAVARSAAVLDSLVGKGWGKKSDAGEVFHWTDDYINILAPVYRSIKASWSAN